MSVFLEDCCGLLRLSFEDWFVDWTLDIGQEARR